MTAMQASLIIPIERDISAYIFFVGGKPTQAGIVMLIQHLQLSLDVYPMEASRGIDQLVDNVSGDD
jgi:hypothetical protein